MNWDELTPEERLLAEQAVLQYRELNQACDDAADGKVLDVCEQLALKQGREMIRKNIELSTNAQAQTLEKKGRRADAVVAEPTCDTGAVNHGG